MTNYRRLYHQGGCYFFTVNLANRQSKLLTEHIELLKEAFRHVKQHHPFVIDALVVLPNHLHCVLTLPEGDSNHTHTHTKKKKQKKKITEKKKKKKNK